MCKSFLNIKVENGCQHLPVAVDMESCFRTGATCVGWRRMEDVIEVEGDESKDADEGGENDNVGGT